MSEPPARVHLSGSCSDQVARPSIWRVARRHLVVVTAGACLLQAMLSSPVRAAASPGSPNDVEPTAAATVQSCDNAFDQTGLAGAGVGSLTAVGGGFYQLSVSLNPDTQTLLAGGVIWPATANIWSGGSLVAVYAAGNPRPVTHTFHALVHLQGLRYGPKKRLVLQRGNVVIFRIHATVTTPTTLAYIHGRIECQI